MERSSQSSRSSLVGLLVAAVLAVAFAGPAAAQAGRDGCYFGECPGGRPPPAAGPPATPPKPVTAPPRPPAQKQSATPPRTAAGPKVGGDFCRVINEVAGHAGDEFAPLAGRKVSDTTTEAKRSLPGADACALVTDDGARTYLCVWQVETSDMAKLVADFARTVGTCFEEAEQERVEPMVHRIYATDDADILVVGDVAEKRVIMEIMPSEGEDDEEEGE